MAARLKPAPAGPIDLATINISDTLERGAAWIRATQAKIALSRAADFYGTDPKRAPVIYTDGVRGRPAEQVKLWGTILFVPSQGPFAEAIQMAQSIIQGAAGRQRTGFYARQFVWFVNGDRLSGIPDGTRIGAKSNIQLANLAPYATIREIQVPRGVIYAAYLALNRAFGKRLIISYTYRRPQGAFTPADASAFYGQRKYPLNVPVLTIAAPGSNTRRGASAPGSKLRRRVRRDIRDLRRAIRRKGGGL